MTIPLLKAIFVLIILAVMIIVLISINHFFTGELDSADDIEEFRKEIEDKDNVITDKNVFSSLIDSHKQKLSEKHKDF